MSRAALFLFALCLLGCGPALAAPAHPTPAKPPDPRRIVGPVAAVVVLAAGGVGTGFLAVSSSNNSAAADLRTAIVARHGTCIANVGGYDYSMCPALQGKLNAYTMYGDAAVGAFITGGAVAAGTALYLLWPSREIRLTPIVGPTGTGLVVSGRWGTR